MRTADQHGEHTESDKLDQAITDTSPAEDMLPWTTLTDVQTFSCAHEALIACHAVQMIDRNMGAIMSLTNALA